MLCSVLVNIIYQQKKFKNNFSQVFQNILLSYLILTEVFFLTQFRPFPSDKKKIVKTKGGGVNLSGSSTKKMCAFPYSRYDKYE